MTDAPLPPFKPKPLPPESVEAPLEPRWKILGPEDSKKLHERALDESRRWRGLGVQGRRRLWRLGLGTAVAFTILSLGFVGGFRWYVPVSGLLLGVFLTFVRLPDTFLAILYGAAGFALILASLGGQVVSPLDMIRLGLGTVLFSALGWFVGMNEDMRRLDGLD